MNIEMQKLKQQIAATSKRLYDKGFTPGYSSNISIRFEDKILVTPSGMSLHDVGEEDVVIIDFNGNIIEGNKKPTSESFMHIAIYQQRPDVNGIIHCHAPKSSAFAVAQIPLSAPILAENVFTLGEIPVVEYALPSSDKLAHRVADSLKNNEAVLMANHGVTIVGKDIEDAFYKADTLEYYAEVYLNTKILGRAKELDSSQVQEIIELKKKFHS